VGAFFCAILKQLNFAIATDALMNLSGCKRESGICLSIGLLTSVFGYKSFYRSRNGDRPLCKMSDTHWSVTQKSD